MAGRAGAAGSRRNSGVGPEKQQQEPWPEEISLKLNQYAMMQAYLLMGVTGIGYLALTWSTVVLLGGFVTVLGKKDFWCLTFISMIQAASIFKDWEEGVMFNFFALVLLIMDKALSYLIDLIEWTSQSLKRTWIIPFLPILYLSLPVSLVLIVLEVIYVFGAFICAGISLWRVIQRDYGNMDGDNTKANLMPALDLFYSLILCQGALYFLWFTSISRFVVSYFVASIQEVCELPSLENYLADTRSKCWRDPKSMKDRRLIKYAVDLLDSESSQDYLLGARMLDVFINHQVDVRPHILPSSQKVQKLMDTLRWSSSDREIKELAARILAHLACDMDLTQFPGAIRCISSLLGTTLPYWNSQQGSSNQSPQSKLDQQGAADSQGDRGTTVPCWNNQQGSSNQSPQSKLDQQGAADSQEDRGTTVPCWNNQQGSSNQSPQSKLDQQGAADSQGDRWNELILQGLTILERLASDQHNCRDICSTPDLIAKIMSPIYSDTLIQDINIMAWQYVVNGAFRVVHRLIRAPDPEWTGRSLAREISCSKQAVSNLERILDQGNTASQELQMRAMEILTELALDSSANLATETKENLINKQLQIFLNKGKEEDLKVTAGKTLALLCKPKLLSKTGTISVCIMSQYNYIVDQVIEILDAKNKIIYRKIAAEILENLCTLHTMDKEYVKNTLLPKVLTEVLTSKKKLPSEEVPRFAGASQSQLHRLLLIFRKEISKPSGDVEENPQQDDKENQRQEHNGQIISSEQNETQTTMMELKEALLSLTSVICDKLIISAHDFDYVARQVAPGEGEFGAKLKTIVEENCEATTNSLRIVKLCGQIAVTMKRRGQYSAYFKDPKFVDSLSKASTSMSNLESCMLFAGTDCGAKKTVRPLLSDLVKELVA